MITLFGIRICPLDLVTDDKTGRLSSTKIWMHIANIIMSKVILTQQTVGWDLFAAYGGIVGGSHVAIFWLKRKYSNVDDSPSVSKE